MHFVRSSFLILPEPPVDLQLRVSSFVQSSRFNSSIPVSLNSSVTRFSQPVKSIDVKVSQLLASKVVRFLQFVTFNSVMPVLLSLTSSTLSLLAMFTSTSAVQPSASTLATLLPERSSVLILLLSVMVTSVIEVPARFTVSNELAADRSIVSRLVNASRPLKSLIPVVIVKVTAVVGI